ncbi:hypothetical protein, partial [Caballeronia sp. M23-90]
ACTRRWATSVRCSSSGTGTLPRTNGWHNLTQLRDPKFAGNVKQNVCLNSASASFLVIRLAARWLDVQRDLDADGWQQLRIDPSSLAALDAEAPPDAAAFAEYAVRIAGHRDTYFDEQEWIEIRDFVRGAAAARHPLVCSY